MEVSSNSPTEDVMSRRNPISSEIVHIDTVMSANQGKIKNKKRKRGKNLNALANVDPMEVVTLQRNSIGSEMVHSDTVMSAKKGKKKKKKKKRGKNSFALANVDLIQQPIDGTCLLTDSRLEKRDVEVEDCVNLRKTSFGNSSLSNDSNISGRDSGLIVDTRSTLEVNVYQVPEANVNPVSMIVEHSDQVFAHNGSKELSLEASLSKKKKKRKKGRKNLNFLLSNCVQFNGLNAPSINNSSLDNGSVQLATTSTADKHSKMNAETTPEADADPIYKVEGDDNLACSVDISRKMVMVPQLTLKAKRKLKRVNLNTLVSSAIMPSTSVMGDSELMQHRAEQEVSQGIHQNECATKDKNCSGEDSNGIIDVEVDKISVSQEKAVANIQGGEKRKRKIRGKNLNLKPEEGVIFCNDLSETQQVKRANADQNVGIGKMLTSCAQKKLLILDLNGLLADVVGGKTVTIKADGHVDGKKIFKRPFCGDFLQFCFNRFTVGVWSSRKKENVDKVLQVLMRGRDRPKLAFVWNQSHCTRTGFKTIENRDKPLFLKELSKLWKNNNTKFPWKVGDYDKSNTLLLDDSPYKALQNPPYTAIFPTPYQYQDQNDNALAPGGDLRVYLEGLALAEDVQKYVEQNPFGQKPITESDRSWSFYAKVIHSRSREQTNQHRNNSHSYLDNRVAPASKSIPV